MKEKNFCIGLNKTGSTSLHHAFLMLGYNSVHYQCKAGNLKEIIKNNYQSNNLLLTGIEDYDVYLDWSNKHTHHLFRELDKQYPGSRFILTTRDLEDWLISREKHVNRTPNIRQLRQQFPNDTWYNCDKEAWKKEYDRHHDEVKKYFSERSRDFLVFNVFKGDSWEKLCAFLGKDVPDQPFPTTNTARQSRVLNLIRSKKD